MSDKVKDAKNKIVTDTKNKVSDKFDFKKISQKLVGISDFDLNLTPDTTLLNKDKLKNRVLNDLKSTKGSVDLNYSYGLNTVFIDTSRSIGSIFSTRGDFSTGIVGIPVNVSFNYSTLRVPLGANNYFRISLDKDKLIEQQKAKLKESVAKIEDQQAALSKKQADLSGLMGYVEVYLDKLKRMAIKEAMKKKDELYERAKDSLSVRYDSLNNRVQDSLSVKYDSLNAKKQKVSDSLSKINYEQPNLSNPVDYQLYYDSIMKIYNRISTIKKTYDSLSNKLESSKQLLNSYQTQLTSPDLLSNGLKKTGFLESIKTIDIGLTYPKTTSMSSQNVPIKGIHTEFQFKNYYLSFATGLTLNNLMLSTNDIQNQLNYSQNVFNNFDFQQIMNNGWLTAIRTGYGTPEGTHAFVGFNYLTNTRFLNPAGSSATSTAYDPAASLELDLRYVPSFLKGGSFDLVYGKTSLNKLLDTITSMGVFESIFSGYQSNLLLGRYTQAVSKIRSEFSLTYRRIDAYANTTTFGTMQPNNQRIEVATNHRVAKFMKVGLLYRFDETLRAVTGMNNLRLHVSGGNISGNYTSYFNYTFFLNHVHHTLQLPSTTTVQRGNNYLLGLNLNSNYEVGELRANTTLSYNDYLISDTSGLNKYTQFGLMQTFGEQKYTVAASYDYFYKRTAGVTSGTSVFGVMGKYNMEKVKLGAGIKLASDFSGATSMGGHVEVLWQVYKFLDVSMRAERFVLGDFYKSYYRTQYEQFPYLMSIQTRFKI